MAVHYSGLSTIKGVIANGTGAPEPIPEEALTVDVDSLPTGIDVVEGTTIINNQQNSYNQYAKFGPSRNTGKRYFELRCISGTDGGSYAIGACYDTLANNTYLGGITGSLGYWGYGRTFGPGSTLFSSGLNFGAGDIVNFVVDIDNGEYWSGVNGVWRDDPDSTPGLTYPASGNNIMIGATTYDVGTSVEVIGNLENLTYPVPASCVAWASI